MELISRTRWSFGTRKDHAAEFALRSGRRFLSSRTARGRRAALPAPAETGGDSPEKVQRTDLAVLSACAGVELRRGGEYNRGSFRRQVFIVFAAGIVAQARSNRARWQSHCEPRGSTR